MPFFPDQRFRILISMAKNAIQARDDFLIARRCGYLPALQTQVHQSITITQHNRSLETVFATPAKPSAAILLFHGIGDRLTYWQSAQRLLLDHNIASLVFHYSGYGKSTGATTPRNLDQDAHAAYAALLAHLPESVPIHLLGFSLGTGIAADAALHLSPPPAGLILCQAFTSLRLAAASVAPAALSTLLPDIWQTHRTIADISLPLLLVHGDADELFPTSMAQQIESAAKIRSRHSVELVQPTGFTHNEPYARPTLAYWQPIIDFVQRTSSSGG